MALVFDLNWSTVEAPLTIEYSSNRIPARLISVCAFDILKENNAIQKMQMKMNLLFIRIFFVVVICHMLCP
jgi:hypothetical protein